MLAYFTIKREKQKNEKYIFSLIAVLALGLFYGCDQSDQASTDEIKIGVILGFTGPIESLTPTMASSAELAMKEVSDSGLLLGGAKGQVL